MSGMNRKLFTLALLVVCINIHFRSPVVLGQSPSWRVDSGCYFNTGGDISFSTTAYANDVYVSGSLFRFDGLQMGETWGNLGLYCPSGASMIITRLAVLEIRASVTVTSGLKEFQFYLGGKGQPGTILGGKSSSYVSGSDTFSVFTDMNEEIILRWSAPPSGGPGGTTTPPTLPESPITIPPNVPGSNWLNQNLTAIAVVGIIAVLVYSRSQKPNASQLRKKTMNGLLPNLDDLNDSKDEFLKKLKRSVWR